MRRQVLTMLVVCGLGLLDDLYTGITTGIVWSESALRSNDFPCVADFGQVYHLTKPGAEAHRKRALLARQCVTLLGKLVHRQQTKWKGRAKAALIGVVRLNCCAGEGACGASKAQQRRRLHLCWSLLSMSAISC